jgi:hypothetical protein
MGCVLAELNAKQNIASDRMEELSYELEEY